MSALTTQRHVAELQLAYAYCLSQLSNLGERSAFKLKTRFPTHQSWLQLTPSERQEATKSTLASESRDFVNVNFDALIDRALTELRNHQREGIRVLSIDDKEYPELLKLIKDPPLVLFVKGSVDALSGSCSAAVIGTRNATSTGERVAFKVARWLAENKWCVVSGLAKGIDTAAHKGTIEARSPTIAVMATPLNKVYPAENRELADEILKHGGCWVSEYPLWKKPYRSAFVQRDRIQSGMSVAVIPVQTDVEGGTMHTVRFAEQQGRLVLCPRPIPGEHALKQYAGIRALIESHRAIPFSGEEYSRVLEFLNDRRTELLKKHTDGTVRGLSQSSVSVAQETTSEPRIAEIDVTNLTTDDPHKVQGGFQLVGELPKKKRPKAKPKELRSQIAVLEHLRDEILDGKRGDGTPLVDVRDVKEWIEQKIRDLRGKADGA